MNIDKRNVFKQIIGTSLLTLSLTALAENPPMPPSETSLPHDATTALQQPATDPVSTAATTDNPAAPRTVEATSEEKVHWGKEDHASAPSVPTSPVAPHNSDAQENNAMEPHPTKPKENSQKSKKGSSFKNFFSHGEKSSKDK